MNYKNGNAMDVTVAKGAIVRKYVTEGRYNAIFMTYDELQKIWKGKCERLSEDDVQ